VSEDTQNFFFKVRLEVLTKNLYCTTNYDRYLSRNDDELEKLQAQRKDSKRPKSSRQDLLEALIKKEREEYDKGFGKWR
jgi:hypothetical protein